MLLTVKVISHLIKPAKHAVGLLDSKPSAFLRKVQKPKTSY